jgi:hypothetical protein
MPLITPKIRQKIASLYNQVTADSQWYKYMHAMEVEKYLKDNLFTAPKYLNNKKLNIHEYQVFSQFGEDGIINEIFRRIGVTNKFFIEFGVENGLECNTVNLLLNQWQGLWIDGSEKFCKAIGHSFEKEIAAKRLAILNKFITRDNIESIFAEANVPAEPDLLSIDIDFNDYYIWEAVKKYRPRAVILEYNAVIRPDVAWTVEYNEKATATGTSYFGASLKAFELLGKEKGYYLVGCTFSGVNAFFVREDCVGDLFEAPFTAANHYEPPRYFLYSKNGHPRAWGNHRLL